MKILFLGVGTQFSGHDQYHSNLVITARSGRKMLVDCGSDARFSLAECGLKPADLDAVYISHIHADHVGGLEWLALSTYFHLGGKHLKLFCEESLRDQLWDHSLKGGLECTGRKCMHLADYFDCCPIAAGSSFHWEGLKFDMVKMRHIIGEHCSHYSYGLIAETPGNRNSGVFISTDTLFQPELLNEISQKVGVIFHDCETGSLRSTVHAHYEELCTLPDSVREKIWLYHYQSNSGHRPQQDGFRGFVVKGQEFRF